ASLRARSNASSLRLAHIRNSGLDSSICFTRVSSESGTAAPGQVFTAAVETIRRRSSHRREGDTVRVDEGNQLGMLPAAALLFGRSFVVEGRAVHRPKWNFGDLLAAFFKCRIHFCAGLARLCGGLSSQFG